MDVVILVFLIFLIFLVKSIHRKRMPVNEVKSGQTASFSLKKIKRSQIRKVRKVAGCMSVCSVGSRLTDMVLLYSEASYWSKEGL